MEPKSSMYLQEATTLRNSKFEKILVLFISQHNQIIGKKILTQKSKREIRFTARSIFKPALIKDCNRIVVIHNHPSGRVFPSQSDYLTTLALSETAALLDIDFLDHLIVTAEDYFSFREAGIL